jgi:hypothetical protein
VPEPASVAAAAPVAQDVPVAPVASPRPAVEFGFLTLDTTPWSTVMVDGAPLGQTPLVRAKLPVGPHVLTLVTSGHGVATTYQVTIEAGKTSVRRLGLD